MTQLTMRPVRRAQDNVQTVEQLYLAAFPEEERLPFWLMRCSTFFRGASLLAFYDGGAFVGFAYIIAQKAMAYIGFFAVAEHLRSHGYGTQMLDCIARHYPGKTLVLDIERVSKDAPNAAQRLERQEFYLRNGFESADCTCEIKGVTYEAFMRGGTFTKQECAAMYERLRPARRVLW